MRLFEDAANSKPPANPPMNEPCMGDPCNNVICNNEILGPLSLSPLCPISIIWIVALMHVLINGKNYLSPEEYSQSVKELSIIAGAFTAATLCFAGFIAMMNRRDRNLAPVQEIPLQTVTRAVPTLSVESGETDDGIEILEPESPPLVPESPGL